MKRPPDHIVDVIALPVMEGFTIMKLRYHSASDVPVGYIAGWLTTAHCEVLYRYNIYLKEGAR